MIITSVEEKNNTSLRIYQSLMHYPLKLFILNIVQSVKEIGVGLVIVRFLARCSPSFLDRLFDSSLFQDSLLSSKFFIVCHIFHCLQHSYLNRRFGHPYREGNFKAFES